MKKFFLSALLMAMLIACSKSTFQQPFTPGPAYNIPAEFKAWTIFNPGSWWVYKNEKTNVIDTTKFTHGPFYNKELCGNCPVIEYMWFYLKGPVVIMYDVQGGKNENASLRIMRENGSEILAFTNKTIADPSQSDSSEYSFKYQLVEQLDSWTMNGKTFSNIYHTKFSWLRTSYEEPSYPGYDFYFARGIGLILLKKNYSSTDTTWSLVNWHTVQ